MRRPSRRISRLLGFTVVPVSLVATGLFVTASSYSVFNATTNNSGNTWTAGTMTLANDTSNTAVFNPTALYPSNTAPSSSGSRCITVTYTGASIPANIKMYASGVTNTPGAGGTGLAAGIQLTIETGASGTNSGSNCTGFIRDSGAPANNVFTGSLLTYPGSTPYASPASNASTGTWSPTTTATKQYMITWKFPSTTTATDNTYQGGAAGVNFVWEAQNS
jgi:hypothetical protein